ncbi:golgin subfamily A member 2-like [Dipodomys spectabilis]|uniref:golgin subfamily A member 2-like n=1 Tax=Dipodomys spectabilis TaxID=105255 RepID=UPI001C541BF7|nr:golgin subfamily A member 2-like [Dipodomys spectabilis]
MKLSAITTMQNETEKKNLQLMKDLNNVKLQLQEKSKSYDDLQEVNIQLQEKLEVLQTQKINMKNRIRKFQQALVERAALKRQLDNLKRLAITLNLERDNFVEDLRKEKSTWKENGLGEEKKQGVGQVLVLETNLMEPRKKLAELQPPAGPSQAEQQLQAQVFQMQNNLKNLEQQLHIQVQENQSLEQQKQLWRLEKKAEDGDQYAKNWHQILESLKCVHVHNTELKDQLVQMQDAFHRVSGEKEELTSILNTERQVKKHLHEKLEQQEEKLQEWKVMAEIKSQVVQNLQELHDHRLAHLQELTATCEQHRASNQQLASEEETLQQHLLKQTQMLEQLKQGQTQTKFKDQMVPQKLQNTLRCLEATRLQKEQLQVQLSFLPFSKEGEGVSNEEEKGEESTPPDMTFQEDVDNPQTRRDVYLKAPSVAESKKIKFSEQLQDQQACCRFLANLTAPCQTKLEKQPFFPKSWKHGMSGDKKQDSQLSEHLSAIEESIVFCKEQLEVLEELFQEKDECVNQMSQEKMEKKAKLQKLLLLLANEVTECQGKMPEDTETPAAATISGPMETEFRGEQKGLEVQLKDNVEPVQEAVRVPCLLEDSTKEHVLWMPDVQHHQELAWLANERSVSFFSRLMQMISLR